MNTDCIPALSEEIKGFYRQIMVETDVFVSMENFDKYVSRVERGVDYFSNQFTAWWLVLREKGDVIRVEQPPNSPYNLVMTRFNREVGYFPSDRAVEYGFIPQMLQSIEERKILNALWKEWIDTLCSSFPYKIGT